MNDMDVDTLVEDNTHHGSYCSCFRFVSRFLISSASVLVAEAHQRETNNVEYFPIYGS